MLSRIIAAALIGAAVVAGTSLALPDEAVVPVRPAAAPTATFAEFQRFLNGQGPGGGPSVSTAEYWIDPVCTGYGPGLGPPRIVLSARSAIASAATARPLSRPAPDATEPDQPR